MSNKQPQISRRDWFRLSKPTSQRSQQQKLGSQQLAGMQSIEEPVNHGGVDLTSLPPIHEATLDTQDVTLLFADIEQYGTAVTLISRRAGSNAPDQSEKLSSARDQLLSGSVRKLQIRYHWENANWIDTLESSPSGFRLIRIRHVLK